MIEFITDLLDKMKDKVAAEYIIYGALGLTAVVFLIIVFCSAYPARFKKATKSLTESMREQPGNADLLNEKMQAFPKRVAEKWNRFYSNPNADSVAAYIDQATCVDAPLAGKDIKNSFLMLMLTALIAGAAFGLSAYISGTGAMATMLALSLTLVLGVICIILLYVAARSRYNKTLKAFYVLQDTLVLNMPASSGRMLALPAPAEEFTEASETEAIVDAAPAAPAVDATAAEEAAFQPPSESAAAPAPQYSAPAAAPVVTAPAEPVKEDIVTEIERVTREGASKQTLLEIAKMLQAERQKPENKTPEQQKRLNYALAALLKAISAANQ